MSDELIFRRSVKAVSNTLAAVIVRPAVWLCWLETRRGAGYERAFHACGQMVAILPGFFGMCLRRAFYCGAVDACSWRCQIGFGAILSHRDAIIEDDVYIGNYALLGRVVLRKGCLIGSRSSVLSTGEHHVFDDEGRWTTPDNLSLHSTEIGAYAWIGEGAIVMADIGKGAMIVAGAVVGTKVPDHVMVAGNPARFVKKLL
ncbi:acyltransferase [Planctomycetaceae bacterium SH139]